MNILSIQSHVAYGHVGNSTAVFCLQRLGHEVWAVPTVCLSNHTGYPTWAGPTLSAEQIAQILDGLDALGVLAQVDAVLTGYLGGPDLGAVVLDAVERVKRLNPRAVYCCDPVMGDVDQGLFTRPGVAELLRDALVPHADLVTPNLFELGFLTGRPTHTLDEVLAAADALRAAGPASVLVTSVITEPQLLDTVVVADAGAWTATTERLDVAVGGCGDLTAALFLAHLHTLGAPDQALAATTSSVHAVLRSTRDAAAPELRIVAAQDAIAQPPAGVSVRRLR